jgi:hypothetical protein
MPHIHNMSLKYTNCFQVAALSKAWVCGRLLAGIAGLNPAGRMDVIPYDCCVLSVRGLCFGMLTRPKGSYRLWCVLLRVIVNPL